jgi:hypothetical protein
VRLDEIGVGRRMVLKLRLAGLGLAGEFIK